jgi:pyrimidine deaminase RibD-like protein
MLASSKISKVVLALKDLDPRNNGKGIKTLINSGIQVDFGIAETEVSEFISQYLVLRSVVIGL